MKIEIYGNEEFDNSKLKYAIIFSKYKSKWIYVKHKERSGWVVPSGHREENENIFDTAKRELYEETGLGLNNILRISPFGYNSAGMSDESISIAYINVYGNISNKHQESTEDIHTFFASKDEIKHMLYDKNIKWGLKAWIICDMLVNGNPFE